MHAGGTQRVRLCRCKQGTACGTSILAAMIAGSDRSKPALTEPRMVRSMTLWAVTSTVAAAGGGGGEGLAIACNFALTASARQDQNVDFASAGIIVVVETMFTDGRCAQDSRRHWHFGKSSWQWLQWA